jgi:hypothetical protein
MMQHANVESPQYSCGFDTFRHVGARQCKIVPNGFLNRGSGFESLQAYHPPPCIFNYIGGLGLGSDMSVTLDCSEIVVR